MPARESFFTQFNRMIGAGIGRIAGGEACEAVLEVKKPYALFIFPEKRGWVAALPAQSVISTSS